jgi:hypothetical protein
MRRIVPTFAVATALAILGVAVWTLWIIATSFAAYVREVPKEIGVALIAAAATVFVSTLTVVLGRYFERKRELDALYRDKKVEIYDEFLRKFFAIFHDRPETQPSQDDMVAFLREFMRKLLLWSGPEVITSFVKWRDNLTRGTLTAQTIFQTEEFLLSLRTDLRHSNRGIAKGFFAKLFLKEGNLFLAAARANPNVTLDEVAKMEKALQESRSKSGS